MPQVDLEGAIKAGGDMHEAMAGVDHAKALEEVRPPARLPHALPHTSLRAAAAELSRRPASRCSCPCVTAPLPRQAFTVFDQRAQDTGALTGNVSSRRACPSLGPGLPAAGCGGAWQRGPRPNPCHGPTMALPWPYHSSEVRHIISNLGIDGLSEEELDEMIAEVDPNGSGVINYKDFVKRIFAPIPPVSEE